MRFNIQQLSCIIAFCPEKHVSDDANTTNQQASEMGAWRLLESEVPRAADVDFVAELTRLHKPSDEGLPSCFFVRLSTVDDANQYAEKQPAYDLS